jgi:hypothetical protein
MLVMGVWGVGSWLMGVVEGSREIVWVVKGGNVDVWGVGGGYRTSFFGGVECAWKVLCKGLLILNVSIDLQVEWDNVAGDRERFHSLFDVQFRGLGREWMCVLLGCS